MTSGGSWIVTCTKASRLTDPPTVDLYVDTELTRVPAKQQAEAKALSQLKALGESCVFQDQTCAGRLEWHHVVTKQRIKRRYPLGAVFEESSGSWRPLGRREERNPHLAHLTTSELLGDTRNRTWLCTHHHELVTNGRLFPTVSKEAQEYADEFNFTADLEADRMRRR